jgi:geranylgeranyl pyrophosphate synthase
MDDKRDPTALVDLDVRPELDRVEALLMSSVASSEPLVDEAAQHLLKAGGKRFRPMLVLLCSHLGNPNDERIVPCAAAIELTHLATLYHDDVMDEASVRRGGPSVNARYDNTVAILTGDYLFAKSSGIAADLGTYVSRVLADTIADLCEGQIMESEHARSAAQTQERYLAVVERKTAVLLATSCHLGAWLAGAPPEQVTAVTEFGRALGVAFQLSDDVIDIAGEEEESGKVPGTDLREGVWTLPVFETLAGRAAGAEPLRTALDSGDVAAALDLLRHNGSVDLALATVARWGERAREALGPIPAGEARTALERLAVFLSDRTH